jgi:hypothetical protein
MAVSQFVLYKSRRESRMNRKVRERIKHDEKTQIFDQRVEIQSNESFVLDCGSEGDKGPDGRCLDEYAETQRKGSN